MTTLPLPGKGPQAAQRLVIRELFGTANAVGDFRDARVCRAALAGLCPSDLFHNTKHQLEPCGKIHDDSLRAKCEAEARAGAPELAQYERELTATLEGLTSTNDRELARGLRKVEDEDGPTGGLVLRVDSEALPEIMALSATLAEKERLGLVDEVDALRITKALAQARGVRAATGAPPAPPAAAAAAGADAAAAPPPPPPPPRLHARLRVCASCNSFMTLVDADERLKDHFVGRIHLGWLTIRQKLHQLREKRKLAPPPPQQQPIVREAGGGVVSGGGSSGGVGALPSRRDHSRSRSRPRY